MKKKIRHLKKGVYKPKKTKKQKTNENKKCQKKDKNQRIKNKKKN